MRCCTSLSSLAPLSACIKLEVLDICNYDFANEVGVLVSLEGLLGCTALKRLDMSDQTSVTSLGPLSACVRLHTLDMMGCMRVESVLPLRASTQLEHLLIDDRGLGALKAALPRLS
ncbi:hypothetical protein FOA52_013814 [Chlamydomonas sp. UWO 241]|nr:hypothetical protein FOA52_013814 [Chlamydomonas sp. UWO 241]